MKNCCRTKNSGPKWVSNFFFASLSTSLLCIKKKLPPQKPGCPPPKQGFRVVADCRLLNEQTIESNFCLPLISETFDSVAAEKPSYFTGFDLRSGFTQLSIHASSQHSFYRLADRSAIYVYQNPSRTT